MNALLACRWHAPDLARCHWASWDEAEYFLFNPASGHTHLLNALARQLLQTLADQPLDGATLAARLYEPAAAPSSAAFAELVAQQLQQLSLMSLVEPAQ